MIRCDEENSEEQVPSEEEIDEIYYDIDDDDEIVDKEWNDEK